MNIKGIAVHPDEGEPINSPPILLFDTQQYNKRLKTLNRDQIQTTSSFIESAIRVKKLIDRDQIAIIKSKLNISHPNFKLVTDTIFDNLLLSALSPTKGIHFRPILILGEPGIGKTFYCNRLSSELDVPKIDIDFSTTTSGFVLSGTSSKWGNASVGAICKMLMTEEVINGVVVIDEIEKAGDSPGSGGNPINSLLTLLEPHSAKFFRDEFLDIPIDASHLNYIATANDVSDLPPQIKSRFTIFEVKKPTKEEVVEIARNAYKNILDDLEIDDIFTPSLSEECVKLVAVEGDARTLKKVITNAIISAVKCDRLEVIPADVVIIPEERVTKNPMGFMT